MLYSLEPSDPSAGLRLLKQMKSRPALYGIVGPRGRPLQGHDLDAVLMENLVLENIKTLSQHGLVRVGLVV